MNRCFVAFLREHVSQPVTVMSSPLLVYNFRTIGQIRIKPVDIKRHCVVTLSYALYGFTYTGLKTNGSGVKRVVKF